MECRRVLFRSCCVRNPDRIAELGRFQTQQRYTVDDNGQATLAYFAGQAISGVIVQPRGGGIHALCGNAFAAMIGLVADDDAGERLAKLVTETLPRRWQAIEQLVELLILCTDRKSVV